MKFIIGLSHLDCLVHVVRDNLAAEFLDLLRLLEHQRLAERKHEGQGCTKKQK